jgi:hypothetical protein
MNIIGLKGGNDSTYFEVLDVKETIVKIYPSIKDGKVLSVLDTGFSADFWKHKKEVPVPGNYAIVAGNAVCAASGIIGALGAAYKAIAVSPATVEFYRAADYELELAKAGACNDR